MSSLHKSALTGANNRLKARLRHLSLGNYRIFRQAAFELEMLAKFYRKVSDEDEVHYKTLIAIVKPLEDRLGRMDEADAMIPFAEKFALRLPDGTPATESLMKEREREWRNLQKWLSANGWRDGQALAQISECLEALSWLEGRELVDYARIQLSKSLRGLQTEIDDGVYDPPRKKGYRLEDVEPRVHKLRREIRKQAQYISYNRGLFKLENQKAPALYAGLLKSDLAKDKFSKLAPARGGSKLKVSRALFLALNRYIRELGTAKDWAFNLARLNEIGLEGEIDFNQLDVTLTTWQGTPVPFNPFVLGILGELRKNRLFEALQKSIVKSR